jgi:L1 cell adhesion molecule like protein
MSATAEQPAAAPAPNAEALKTAGNAAFSKGQYDDAVRLFTEAIAVEPENKAFYSNRSAAYLKLMDYDSAIADGAKCVELDPKWGKGYFRQGSALQQCGKYEEAVKIFASGLAQDPGDRTLSEGLQQSQKYVAERASPEQKEGEEDYVIGIDLGTTYSCVAVWKGNSVDIIPNDRGEKTTPSYVSFSKDGKRLVGQAAKAAQAGNLKNTLYDIKRIIGQNVSSEAVQRDIKHFPFVVESDKEGKPMVQVEWGKSGTKNFAPEEISAMVLAYMKKTAEKYLNRPITRAVITVPAHFGDSQRAATQAAGRIAGLNVLRIINEPTAAALSYGLDLQRSNKSENQNVLIFDLGGGTFDVTILAMENGAFQVKATGGDIHLGGEDFDLKVAEFFAQEAVEQGFPDLTSDEKAMMRFRVEAERAKRQLSQGVSAQISIENLVKKEAKAVGSRDFNFTLTRDKFEKLQSALFQRCLDCVHSVLKDAKLKKEQIDEIVLVGGSTRIPKLQMMLSEAFDGKQLCRSLNPDEAVAYGAAVQGAILNGQRSKATENLLLKDVTPLSLGIETTGRVMSVVIPRNTPIPCTKTQVYTTEADYQTMVDISVYEGERLKTEQNNLLGEFQIKGIERAKRGEPQVNVSFSLDSNGILQVTAKDQKTGAEAKIEINHGGRTSEADIQKMIQDAAIFRREDEAALAQTEARNSLDQILLQCETYLLQEKDTKKKIELEQAMSETRQWLDAEGESAKTTAIAAKKRVLERTLQRMVKE